LIVGTRYALKLLLCIGKQSSRTARARTTVTAKTTSIDNNGLYY